MNPSYCPYCGEEDGTPVRAISREFQGAAGHGGYVEHEDLRCTLCTPPPPTD